MPDEGRKIYIPSYIKLHPKVKRIVEDTAVEYLIDTAKAGYPALLLDESSPFQNKESVEMQWEYLSNEILDEPGDDSYQKAKAGLYQNRAAIQFYIKSNINTIKDRAQQKLIQEGRNLEDPSEDYILGLKVQSAGPTPARRGRPITRTIDERFHGKGTGKYGSTRGRPKGTGYLQRGVPRAADAPKIGRKPFTEEEKQIASEVAKAARTKLPDWQREFEEHGTTSLDWSIFESPSVDESIHEEESTNNNDS